MPGSCDSDQSSSSSSLISSLRKYRFQNKAKPATVPQPAENSIPSSSNSDTSSSSSVSSRPILSQKSPSSAYNPLSYRKYDNSSDSQTLLQNISAKIQLLFRANITSAPILDLKLTIPENDQFKDVVLQSSSLSVKWSSCVNETSTLNPSEKFYKVKKSYLHEVSKHICTALNNKLAKNNSPCITPVNTPIRTYSRAKPGQKTTNQNTVNNSVLPSEGQNPGAMDDYEEFCDKEQSLRKLLDAFPGADIMEAQDILVKCQWDLNKALQEAQSQPLRTTKKRGLPGSGPFMVQTPVPANIQNQPNPRMMSNSRQMQSPPTHIPEEIVLDSSDEDDVNGITPSEPVRPAVNNRPSPAVLPPAKRARRLISTSSSEDEAAASKSSSSSFPKPQLHQLSVSSVQQKSGSSITQNPGSTLQPSSKIQQKPDSLAQPKLTPTAQQKPTPIVQPKPASSAQPVEVQLPKNQNGPSVDKTINIPQALSIKPVPTPAPSNNEQTSSSAAMPNLPKWLVVTQVGGAENSSKMNDKDISGASVNGNHPSVPSNSKGPAQLVRIKASTNVSTPATTAPCGITVNPGVSCIPVNKNVSITPVGTSISMIPVNKSISMTPVSQTVSMTPVSQAVSKTPISQTVSMTPVNQALSVTPVSQAVSKTPVSQAVSKTPVSQAVSKTPVSQAVSKTPVSQAVSKTPVSQAVSKTPVSQAVSIPSTPKMLSITPVGGDNESSGEKSPLSSSTEEETNLESPKQTKRRIKNIDSLLDTEEEVIANEPTAVAVKEKSTVKKRGRQPKGTKSDLKAKNPGRRKKCDYVEEDEDEDYGNEDIYDSEDSDYGGENLTPAHSAVLKFFQDASADELGTIPGCSKKKMEIVQNLRPFTSWMGLVDKLKKDKSLSTDLLNGAKKVIDMRNAISKLMNKCQRISFDMEDLVEDLKENRETSSGYVSTQPELLNERMHLTAYQMLGLNWLLLMHNQQVNGILADEMGLGKTVQAIAFLAYLKQIEEYGPHLIVVPSSTLDNWKKEFETWWPSVSQIIYRGQQESRRELRMQILNDEVDEFDVMITTYNMVTSSAEDRSFFKRLEFNYVVFDEAHMLKNMSSQRYTNLMRIKAPRRLLLTGTPLQNNLVELMSLLIFAMPHMFSGKTEQIKQMFTCVSRPDGSRNSYEKDRIDHAKRIMKPFVLRRLKKDVLKELPAKQEETKLCAMVEDQAEKYSDLVKRFSAEVQTETKEEKDVSSSGAGMMMQLRRAANHPLLLRRFFDDDKLLVMAKKMLKEPTHSQSDPNMIFEDMTVMSDFELHKLCKQYKSIKSYALPDSTILNSGKFKILDELLPELIKEDHRILLFSQFTMVLDIVQEYMNIKKYKFLRLDGQVPVSERQQLIDDFNNDPDILVFLLSTRAGGLGINLTAADTVILHDIDFNPYNDKQAEDRCHRVGQVRNVTVVRFISEHTIEEGILQRAKDKLKLEREIHEEETEENDTASVAMLLRDALGLNKPGKS